MFKLLSFIYSEVVKIRAMLYLSPTKDTQRHVQQMALEWMNVPHKNVTQNLN